MKLANPEAHSVYERELRRHLHWFYVEYLGLAERVALRSIGERLDRTRGKAFAAALDVHIGLEGKKMLDVGSGWGELVLESLARGADVRGVEPDPAEVRISGLLLQSYAQEPCVVPGIGENLPFPDESFDLVTCQQVLDHVEDIDRVVEEMVRVTRPGGQIVVSVPNSAFPYEGHYRVKWAPMLPKRLGKHVLRAMGRNPEFLLEHVNYTTYPRMMRRWRRHQLGVRNLTEELVASGEHSNPIYRSRLWRLVGRPMKLYANLTFLLQKPLRPGQPTEVQKTTPATQASEREAQAAA